MLLFKVVLALVLASVIKGHDEGTKVVGVKVKEFDVDIQIPNNDIEDQVDKIYELTKTLHDKVDNIKECSCAKYHNAVFHVSNGRYTYNYQDAIKACEARGAKLASFHQLQAAWKQGLDVCAAGWLSDGTVRYPITMPRPGCGDNTAAGIRNWGAKPKNQKVADAYCFK